MVAMIFKIRSSRTLHLACLLVFCQITGSLKEVQGQAESPSVSSVSLVEEGKFKEASEKYRLMYLSSQKQMYGKLSEALKVASAGVDYFRDGKFAEAAAVFQESLTLTQPGSEIMHTSVALVAMVFVNCIEASLLAVRGHIVLKQGNFLEAIDIFRTAREKTKSLSDFTSTFDNCINAVTIASVGKSLLVAGNFKESTDIFQRAYEKSEVDAVSMTLLNLKTQSGYAWQGLSSIIQLQCFDNASKSFQNAYEKSTIRSFYFTFAYYRDAANIAKQGSDFLKVGKFSEALEQFQKAIEIFHVNTFASYINATKNAVKGYQLLTEGKSIEALEHFQKALLMRNNIFPGDVDVLVNCGETLSVAAEGQALMAARKFHEALMKFHEAHSKSTVREVKYLLSRLKKLPYEGGSYCRHDDFAAVEHA